ncbi:hypothetical protein TGAMA5MH_00244 [Trichoderma gamsii]|uniref:Uncharacterized protein n=1 Tax=Trichoderma gamsii TaxID=398673 RepID=A0A2K0TTD7_9HYPO|nr:hypothetical protein TGAMA5MH_00244 [Trichoderma gamsii]
MNAFALMAHHRLHVDYTSYCDEFYKVHLSGLISEIEVTHHRFCTGDSRSLEDSALSRRIDRLFNRVENKKAPLELINISDQNNKETTLVLLNSLYDIERAHIKGTGRSYLNLFPEIAQSTYRLEYVNLITFITLGKLSCVLGYYWTHVNERDASSKLNEYISIYHDRLINGWNPTREVPAWISVQVEDSLLPNNGAVGTNMPAKGVAATDTSARDVRTASGTAAQEVNTTSNTPSTVAWGVGTTSSAAQGVHVVTDIDSDGSFDCVSNDEPLELSNLPRMSVFEV